MDHWRQLSRVTDEDEFRCGCQRSKDGYLHGLGGFIDYAEVETASYHDRMICAQTSGSNDRRTVITTNRKLAYCNAYQGGSAPCCLPVHAFQVVDSRTLLALNLRAVRENRWMGPVLPSDSYEWNIVILQQFQKDVVYSRMGVTSQQNGVAQQNSHANQSYNQRGFSRAW